MLTHEQLKQLALGSVRWQFTDDPRQSPPWMLELHDNALAALGNPSDDDIVASALPLLHSDDRNDRVAALRVLGWHLDRVDVAEAVLRATHDPVRRVRRIAVQMVPLAHPGATERLLAIATDDGEYHRISASAFARVARRDMSAETVESIRALLDNELYRKKILHVFLMQGAPQGSESLLEDIVRIGAKHEAVAATRLLCGYRLVRLDQGSTDLQRADVDWLFAPGTLTKTNYARFFWSGGRSEVVGDV
ncbi:MAG: hypothetical protein QOK28_1923 [Actinomycetota bacterium]